MLDIFDLPYVVVVLLLIFVIASRIKMRSIEKRGIKVVGTIIANSESDDDGTGRTNFYRLGGNINYPTIKFTTTDGKEIIGKPVIGFATDFEVQVPSEVYIRYTPENPEEFCVDIS